MTLHVRTPSFPFGALMSKLRPRLARAGRPRPQGAQPGALAPNHRGTLVLLCARLGRWCLGRGLFPSWPRYPSGETEAGAKGCARGHRAASGPRQAGKADVWDSQGPSYNRPGPLPGYPAPPPTPAPNPPEGSHSLPWEGARAGTLPSRNIFPSAALVARRNRRHARGPHPQPAARHPARQTRLVPRNSLPRLHPGATSALAQPRCAPARPGLGARGRLLTWASTWLRRRQ